MQTQFSFPNVPEFQSRIDNFKILTESLAHLSTLVSSIDLLQFRSVRSRKDISKSSTKDPDKVVYNYSWRQLTDVEKKLLARGLNFSVDIVRLKQRLCKH